MFDAVQRAFVDAMQNTFLVSAAVLVTAAATALLIRNIVPARAPEPEAVAGESVAERAEAVPATIGE